MLSFYNQSILAFLSDMAPYYEALCKSLEWQIDTELLNKMKKANEEELKRLDNELEDAEKILGESEIRDAMMAKAEYLCRIGDKVGSLLLCLTWQVAEHHTVIHSVPLLPSGNENWRGKRGGAELVG